MPEVPNDHIVDSQKLTGADGFVELLVLELAASGGTFRIKDNGEETWLGDVYEYYPFGISGINYSVDDAESRPMLKLANPDHLFTSSLEHGHLDRALVTRYRVLRANFDANRDIKEQRRWYIRRIVEAASTHIILEMSNLIDGPNYIVPARMFIPPEFAVVSLA